MKKPLVKIVTGSIIASQLLTSVASMSTVLSAEESNEKTETSPIEENSIDSVTYEQTSLSEITSQADIDSPIILAETITVDKSDVQSGDHVKLSMEVQDQSEIASVEVVYEQPETENWMKVYPALNPETNLYQAAIDINESSESGTHKIKMISVQDVHGTFFTIHNEPELFQL